MFSSLRLRRKFVALLSLVSLSLNISQPFFLAMAMAPIVSPSISRAQEVSPTPTPDPSVAPTESPSPDPAASPIESVAPSPSADPSVSPSSSPDMMSPSPTPSLEPSPTPSDTPSPTPSNVPINVPSPSDSSPAPPSDAVASAEASPSVTPYPTTSPINLNEQLQIAIIDNTAATSIQDFDLSVTETGSATLATDKLDYAPTDTALITGAGFLPSTTYGLTVSSTDDPATSTTVDVVTDAAGTLFYAYQLDGIYRPNYRVEAKDSTGAIVAVITFTDTDPVIPPVANPTLTQVCGLDIALVLDVSGSIDSTELSQMKTAMTGLVTALAGTPTEFSVSKFDTTASVVQGFIGTTATVNTAINGVSGGGYTNWEDGFIKGNSTLPNRSNPNLVIFASDGQPNTIGAGPGDNASPDGSAAAMNPAITIANTIKTGGSRILGIGIGLNAAGTANMKLVSGPNADTGNFATSDLITTNFATLATQLATFASDTCGGTITVTKKIDADGNINTPDQTVASSWTFNVGGQAGKVTDVNGQTPAVTLTPAAGYDIAETQQAGYSLLAANCIGATSAGSTNLGDNTINDITVGANDIVSCTFINTPNTGTINIVKVGQYNRTQQFGFITSLIPSPPSPAFSLDDNSVSVLSNTKTFTDVIAGVHTVSEIPTDGWTLASIVCSDQDSTSGLPAAPTATINLAAGETVTCTFTNTEDFGSVKVNKLADTNGDGTFETLNPGTFTWNLNGSGSYTMGSSYPGFSTGIRTVNENSPAGYHLVGWFPGAPNSTQYSCRNLPAGTTYTTLPASITIVDDLTTEITICNAVDGGNIIIVKQTLPDGDTTDFDFTSNYDQDGFILSDGENNDSGNLPAGTYSVAETGETDWSQTNVTCSDQSTLDAISLQAGETVTCTFTNTKLGSIGGFKWEDRDGDGIWDVGEPALANWLINLFFNALPSSSQYTDSVGYFNFINLLPGSYSLTEVMQPGWIQTAFPGTTALGAGDEVLNQNFGNRGNLSITVCKYEDLNGLTAGVQGPGVPNWSFTLGQTTQTTGEGGCTTFEHLTPGTYDVSELPVPTGWYIADDSQGSRRVVLTDSNPIVNFFNYRQGSISGTKWNDIDGDGVNDSAEPKLANWTIYIDTNSNGTLDLGETSTTTDVSGNYTFTNLGPGTYRVREVGQSGWTQTSTNPVDITTASGQNVTGVDFGNQGRGSIMVHKQVDENGNGQYASADDGSFTWTLDDGSPKTMGNGESNIPAGQHFVGENIEVTGYHFEGWFPTNGGSNCTNLPDNTANHNLPISVNVGPNGTSDFTICNARDTGTITIVKDAINNNAQNFSFSTTGGTLPASFQLDDDSNGTLPNTSLFTVPTGPYTITEGSVSGWKLTNLTCTDDENSSWNLDNRQVNLNVETGENITCTFTNTKFGSIQGRKYQDINSNGDFDESEMVDANRLDGWTINLYKEGTLIKSMVTGNDTTEAGGVEKGQYRFIKLLPGTYDLCEVSQTGWAQTEPASGIQHSENTYCHSVTISAGQNLESIQFGNHRLPVTIKAYKVVCENEIYLPNWGDHGTTIDGDTAQEFVENVNEEAGGGVCHLEEGWDFQFGPAGAGSFGDFQTNTSSPGSPWTTFNVNSDAVINDLSNFGGRIETREVFPDNTYFPFSNSDDVSAEFYCSGDVFNYDNWEWINDPQYGQIYYCVAFNAPNTGDLEVTKYNDLNGNGQQDPGEPELAGWEINVQGEESQTTGDGGSTTFTDLVVGSYELSETMPEEGGWTQTEISCGAIDHPEGQIEHDEYYAQIHAGQTTHCRIGNAPLTDIHGYKWNDLNGNGQRDICAPSISDTLDFLDIFPDECIPEPLLGDWTIFLDKNDNQQLDEEEQWTSTASDGLHFGWYWFNDLPPGDYSICEVPQAGWTQTSSPVCHTVQAPSGENTCTPSSEVNSVESEYACNFGNQADPILTIEKSNDATGAQAPGSDVLYTLIIKLEGSNVDGVTVTDTPPTGFTYRPGSWTADSDVRGDLKASLVTTEPTYASPGLWLLGDMVPGEIVTLTYLADVSSSQDSGTYKDIAWATGDNSFSDDPVNAVGQNSEYYEGPFVGTNVEILRSQDQTGTVNIEKTGEVLGASTELPATGANTGWLLLALGLLISGLFLIFGGKFMKKILAVLLLITASFSFAPGVHAATNNLSLRMESPTSPTRLNDWKLSFTALDMADRDITIKCYVKKPTGSFVQFDTDKLLAGGGSSFCQVNSSVMSEQGTYEFKVIGSVTDETDETAISSVLYDTEGPARPTSYSKDHPSSCRWVIKFHTADDGGLTQKVEIYSSDQMNFDTNPSSRVGTVTIGSNQDGEYTHDRGSDCDKTWYYVIRAFDGLGNQSAHIGDEVNSTITVTPSASPTAGALVLTSATGSVLGQEVTTASSPEPSLPAASSVEGQGLVAGATDALKSAAGSKGLWWIFDILAIVVIIYVIFRRRQTLS